MDPVHKGREEETEMSDLNTLLAGGGGVGAIMFGAGVYVLKRWLGRISATEEKVAALDKEGAVALATIKSQMAKTWELVEKQERDMERLEKKLDECRQSLQYLIGKVDGKSPNN